MMNEEPDAFESAELTVAETHAAEAQSATLAAAVDDQQLEAVIHLLRSDPQALAHVVASMSPDDVRKACPEQGRKDGWTPFARRLFLEVLAETGRVSRACEYAQLSVSSAYALRHRDPVFAAGWDAACELARTALADALYERALDGTTETVTRNGEVIAERHRHDSRLSIAVLNRLDKRCDRAADLGARHLPIIEKWDEWLRLVGKGAENEAAALLQSARSESSADLQLPQLAEGANPTHVTLDDEEDEGIDLSDRCWREDDEPDGQWLTSFPPPPGFTGYENRPYDEDRDVEPYERECTPQEVAILKADEAAAAAAERAEDEELRDAWFEMLKRSSSGSITDGADCCPAMGPQPAKPAPCAEGEAHPTSGGGHSTSGA